MTFHIITLFPSAFDSYLGESILKRAIADKKIAVKFYNPRDFEKATSTGGLQKRIDDKPYGGGPGMVIRALPVIKAIEKALAVTKRKGKKSTSKIVFLSPSGKQFTTDYAKTTAKKYSDIIIVSGRYEGIDARIKKVFKIEDISIGPFVLTGGELPAMILIDCIARQKPGVLGDFGSLEESRAASADVYTRPEIFVYKNKKYKVPAVLLSGNHKDIEAWRTAQNSEK